jgi:methionine-rich copper-binding protein CopC/putative copper export protein
MRYRLYGVIIATGFLLPQLGFAHATPVTYGPEAGSVLQQMPDEISIRFSERLEPGSSRITVFAPDGTTLAADNAKVDPADRYKLTTSLPTGGSGTYAVSWSVISADDGHFTKGAFSFSISKASATATDSGFSVTHSSDAPEALTIWLELVGHAILLGTLCLLAALRFAGATVGRDRRGGAGALFTRRRILALVWTAALLGIAGGLAYIGVKSWMLATDQGRDWFTVFNEFMSTAAGRYTLLRASVLLVCAIVATVWKRDFADRDRVWTARESALLTLLFMWALMRARVSHASASPFLPSMAILVNTVHVMGKDLWIGSLVAFMVMLTGRKPRTVRETGLALGALTLLTGAGLLVGGTTGAFITWLHLKGAANLFTTMWGMRFLSLGAAAALLVSVFLYRLLMVNRATERLAAKSPRTDDADTVRAVLFPVTMEMLCGLLVLLLSGSLIITTPPLDSRAHFSVSAESQGLTVNLGEHPYDDASMLVTFAEPGKMLADPGITGAVITASEKTKSIGPLVLEKEQRFAGGYAFPKSELSPPGDWTIEITGQRDSGYDATASFTFAYPTDIDAAHLPHSSRGFDGFALLSVGTAGLLFVLGLLLIRHGRRFIVRMSAFDAGDEVQSLGRRMQLASAIIGLAVLFIFAQLLNHAHGAFEAACIANGDMFHESVPIRDGKAVSAVPVLGCMTGMGAGQRQFGDMREYAFYAKPAKATAEITLDPAVPVVHEPVTMTVRIHDPLTEQPITPSIEHDRILHAIIVSGDTGWFSHQHVEDAGSVSADAMKNGTFQIPDVTFHTTGRNLVAIDYAVRSRHYSDVRYVDVPGTADAGSGSATSVSTDSGSVSPFKDDVVQNGQFEGYAVRLTVPSSGLASGSPMMLRYTIEHDGSPETDLQPYLGAAMHVAAVRDDLRKFVHTHGQVPRPWLLTFVSQLPLIGDHQTQSAMNHLVPPDAFGPNVEAPVTFPAAGTYTVFGEFVHKGKAVTTRFVVEVR